MRGRPRLPNKPLKLKGIHRVKKRQADGSIKVYLYHRATGLPLDEARLAETYADAERKMRTKGEGTFLQLIRHFDQSAYFDGLSDESRKQPRGSLQIPPGVVSQIPPPARQDKGLLV
ncbi:hypothetical protein [Bradyrhizobium liaoningense]|uniref:hypothetical protein n=1 Tax=Bradyrhizobium liaoningense TaxID=43992 RepID=UPI00235D70E1|nr:hypothetical protein [Bradyrhizobium liaoningense]GLR92835.1 hypothetical protein GCM10007858_04570 [Bradyrhizobium liaoningense]